MIQVYILFSNTLKKYYTGYTTHLWIRIEEHNQGKTTFTRTGIPWSLTYAIQCDEISTAKELEIKIKRRGAKRFLDSLKQNLKPPDNL